MRYQFARWLPRAGIGAALALLIASAAPAKADRILTLGNGPGNVETLELTREDLASLPQHTIVTMNEWVDAPVAYSGPLARDVLELLALDSIDTVRFVAANDYFVDIPTSDFHTYDVILATEADGRRLSLRDKGPVWLMYPLSDYPELNDPIYNARLIWQVVRVESL